MALQLNSFSMPQFTDLVNRTTLGFYDNFPYAMRKSGLVKEVSQGNNNGLFMRLAQAPVISRFAKRFDEGAPMQGAVSQYGYEKDLAIYQVGLEMGVTKLERLANKTPEVLARLVGVASTVPNRMELDLTHRLTFGNVTSYVDQDGYTVDTSVGDTLALISATHTLAGSGVTYSNSIGAVAFSKASLETAERLISEQTFDNIGIKIPMIFDVIFCTDDPVVNKRIDEELMSTGSTGTVSSTELGAGGAQSANVLNVNSSRYRKVRLPFFGSDITGNSDTTKRRWWGIASSMNTSLYLSVLESPSLQAPSAGNNGEDGSSGNWYYRGRGSYGIATADAVWIKMATPVS